MKIDRLLGIVMYLLNRENVSARVLAEEFGVSLRTIQRDIEAITLAGIPIVSIHGPAGGYGIMDNFKLDKQIISTTDFFFILSALNSLCSAYENAELKNTIEKVMTIMPVQPTKETPKINVDFSVLREGSETDLTLKICEKAIIEKRAIEFDYTNAKHETARRTAEPVQLEFKWYAWYLLAFLPSKNDYGYFRISRMRNSVITDKEFSCEHDIDKIISEQSKKDSRKFYNIKMLCKSELRVSIEDYFSSGKITELDDGDFILEIKLPEDEANWFGVILNYGNKVKIIEPEEVKKKILAKIKEIQDLYTTE